MKILIDGQTLATPEINRGIGKYFVNTVDSLLNSDFVNDFFLIVPPQAHLGKLSPWSREKLRVLEVHSTNGPDGSKYSDSVNEIISSAGINLYWSPNALMDNVALPLRQHNDCRYSVTIFDLIPLVMAQHYQENWPADVLKRYQDKLEILQTDYDLFLHISQHTRADFTSRLRVADKTHAVTPLAAANSFRPYLFPKIADADDYVLYPGGFDPRKNMMGALDAFAAMHRRYSDDASVRGTRLRIVCHVDAASEKNLRKRARRLNIDNQLDVTGFVTDAELVELYQKARCLFFPSLYEGFGLPVLEGLACGLPIAASNTSSIPEVAGELAFYFDPYNASEMADVLYQTLQQPRDVASRLFRYERARRFSWTRTALATLHAWNN